jgi:ABC-type transporter Mla MlaB component
MKEAFPINSPSIFLYRFSSIDEPSPFPYRSKSAFSVLYHWKADCECKPTSPLLKRGHMLKIQRATNEQVVFTLSGRMDAENVAELKELIESEAGGRRVVLELSDLTLVDREAVKFLERCETESVKLENCPAYIREWIAREREGK